MVIRLMVITVPEVITIVTLLGAIQPAVAQVTVVLGWK
jgi:hypothetical protein